MTRPSTWRSGGLTLPFAKVTQTGVRDSLLAIGAQVLLLHKPKSNSTDAVPAAPFLGDARGAALMERICIVDDDDAVRDLLSVFLEACGYAVTAFVSALALLDSADIAGYICLLLDMHMPGMTGLELIELLRGRGMKTPAILITGAANTTLREAAARFNATHFLDKPVDGDALLNAIDHARTDKQG